MRKKRRGKIIYLFRQLRYAGILCIYLLVVSTASAHLTTNGESTKALYQNPALKVSAESGAAEEYLPHIYTGINEKYANIRDEFLSRQTAFHGNEGNTGGTSLKSLPALPASILMTLTGFLCVSLARDRKFWLTAATTLICLTQAGLHTVPQLISQHSHTPGAAHRKISAKSFSRLHYRHLNRHRSDVEGTRYVGLLHHLEGIPGCNRISNITKRITHKSSLHSFSQSKGRDISSYPVAISAGFSYPKANSITSAAFFEPNLCFSQEFSFHLIPRGPPLAA